MDRARRRAGRPVAPAAAEHHPLDQVDRHRSRVGRRRRRADARSGGRPLQADQQRSLPQRLPRVHLPLHARRAPRASIASRSACRIRISRTSPAGAPPPRASAAAATRGSSRTRRSSGATAIGRIRRRSRHDCPNSACGCTGCRGSRLAMDPFTGLGSTAVACARLGVEFHRVGYRRDVPEGSGRADARTAASSSRAAALPGRRAARDAKQAGRARLRLAAEARRTRRRGGGLSTYSLRVNDVRRRCASPSPRSCRRRFVGSGLLE